MYDRGGQKAGASPAGSILARLAPWALVPVPLLLAVVIGLWFLGADTSSGETSYGSSSLLPVLNVTLGTCTSAVIAVLAGRTFVATGTPGVLCLGAGALLMGIAFTAAPLAGLGAPNITATVHNIGMLAAGALSLVGAWMSFRPRAPVRAPGPVILAVYAAVVGFVAATAYLALNGATPPFFVQGVGGTPLRQVVLATAVGLFGAAALVLVLAQGNATAFRQWYALGLALLAVGLLGVMFQEVLGSPISWVGRVAQYLGSLYLLVASITSATATRRWSLPLEEELHEEKTQARLLREAKEQLAHVLEGSNDGFWDWNIRNGQVDFSARWAEMFGYHRSELAPSVSTWQGMIHPDDREEARGTQRRIFRGEIDRYEADRRLRHKDGHWVWVHVRGKVVERDGDGKPARMAGTYTDISERKAAEEALRASESRLTRIASRVPLMLYDYVLLPDGSSRLLYVGPHCRELFELEPEELVADMDRFWRMVDPDDLARLHREDVTANRMGVVFQSEVRISTPSGRRKWIQLSSRPNPALPGEPAVWSGYMADVTDRKRAEEDLAKARDEAERRTQELQAVLDAVPAAIFITRDVSAKHMETNRFGANLMKVPLGANVSRSAPEDQRLRTFKAMKNGLELSPQHLPVQVAAAQGVEVRDYEFDIVTEDGVARHLVGNASPLGDESGKPIGAVGAFVDVTTIREAETRARATEARLARVIEASTDGYFEVDYARKVVEASPRWNEISGRPSEPSSYSLTEWERMTHPDDMLANVDPMRALSLGTSERLDITYRVRQPSGLYRWVRTRARTITRDSSGRPQLVVGTTTDIQDQRATQEQLLVASKLAAVGTLVAGLAHEINNPLAAVLAGHGLALEVARAAREQLLTGAPVDATANVRELDGVIEGLEDAVEAGQRVAQVVRDMAAFSRPEATRIRVNLRGVVNEAIRWVPNGLSALADIEVEDRGAPEVLGSAGHLTQVVQNLLANALKATSSGSRGKVILRLGTDEAGRATLDVIDQGVGIAPNHLKRIFEPFFTTRPVGEGRGAGLGLAICHSIVATHGGKITVETEVGKGSTFRVELPAAPAEA